MKHNLPGIAPEKNLKVALIQSSLHWHNPAANRAMFEEKFAQINTIVDAILLPEMFTTGFTMQAVDFAETMTGDTVVWLRAQAQKFRAHIGGSIIAQDGGKFYNRFLWADPAGNVQFYDKRHLFRMAREHEVYSAGEKKLIVEVNGWRILPLVCYDLRFPVWCRSKNLEYDLAVFVANWPEKRSAHWRALLPVRAIENQAFVIGVNRVGEDGHGFAYCGDTCIISPKGKTQAIYKDDEYIAIHTLKSEELLNYRTKFPAWRDADAFNIR